MLKNEQYLLREFIHNIEFECIDAVNKRMGNEGKRHHNGDTSRRVMRISRYSFCHIPDYFVSGITRR